MRAGVSLAETILVCGILLLLAGLMSPVAQKAVISAKEAVSKSNMRQLHVATELYRAGWGEGALYGKAEDMGLPGTMFAIDSLPALLELRPPLAPHPMQDMLGGVYHVHFAASALDNRSLKWEDYSQEMQGRSVLYIDPFFTPADRDPLNPLNTVTLWAINLNGSITRREGRGEWQERSWWLEAD